MAEDPVDIFVIGAGVIGLAVARRFAMAGREVVIAERASMIGTESSSRNSEVIHAGIYYQPGSLKASLCGRGKTMLYDFCDSRSVSYRRCGKLIVATDETQVAGLEEIWTNAAASGTTDLGWLDAWQALRIEPEIRCCAALYSPSSGILDSHAYMLALLGDAESHGAILACNTQVEIIRRTVGGWEIWIAGENGPVATARTIINCAGLHAHRVAQKIEDFESKHIPSIYYAKGSYFSYSSRTEFSHLIYPVPEPGGLGIHLTLDLAGGVRFGPDVEWVDSVDYGVSVGRRHKFAKSVMHFWPGINEERLSPAYSGIRPKLTKPGALQADFMMSGPDKHGYDGIFNLFGIESPGLTASLALADMVFLDWTRCQN